LTALMDQSGPAAHKAAEIIKSISKNINIILGGVYATMNVSKIIQDNNIDYIVIGEGEYVFKDLIGYFNGTNELPKKGICYRKDKEIINTGHSDFITELDKLPLPAYHLINFEEYSNRIIRKSVDRPRKYPFANILTSRGCPYGCTFCQVESISGKKVRTRSSENVLNEIEFLKEKYGIKSIIFSDDNLFFDKKRITSIMEGMIERDLVMPWIGVGSVWKLDEPMIKLMKQSGCEYLNFAIESGNIRVLKEIVQKPVNYDYAKKITKIARDYGIYTVANFIVGFPTETWDEIRDTIKFAEDINVDYIKLFAAFPLKNTKLWDLAVKHNAFKKDFTEEEEMWSTGKLESSEYTSNDLTILRAYEWDRINFTLPNKRKLTAKMMGITEGELLQIRRETLNNACSLIVKNQI